MGRKNVAPVVDERAPLGAADAAVHTADQPAAPPALVSRPRGTSGVTELKQLMSQG